MELSRHEDIEKDFRKLKKFPAAEFSLEAWEKLFALKGLSETPAIDAYPGFGKYKVYKGRVVPLLEKVGKSKGYRVIFQLLDNAYFCILVFSRHGVYKTEQELMELIKARLM